MTVPETRQYTQSLDHNLWEQAWLRHLEEEIGSNGSIDWAYDDRQALGTLTDEYQQVIEADGGDPSVLDTVSVPVDPSYDTALAAVLEHEAEMDLAARRFHAAHDALDRALRTDWTTPRTVLFKAIAVRNTTTASSGRKEAPEPRIEAERALWRIRQNRPAAARRHLARCRQQIEELRSATPSEQSLSAVHDSLYTWAATLEARLRE
ncbi:MAG: hypothetical protein BRD55_02505 [Bacteroidetes bacterium SW_9_63_38]|nr:MAG: hypothetical protein BRD55_02505 [Bacteroidetes bacterium SW_9_63_38]